MEFINSSVSPCRQPCVLLFLEANCSTSVCSWDGGGGRWRWGEGADAWGREGVSSSVAREKDEGNQAKSQRQRPHARLCAQQATCLGHRTSETACQVGTVIEPISQMSRLRHREVRRLVPGRTARGSPSRGWPELQCRRGQAVHAQR